MSSGTKKSMLTYAVMGLGGGSIAYYRFEGTETTKYSDYPKFIEHNNWMSKQLTEAMYEGLRRQRSPSGANLDDCIQVGVDLPGDTMSLPLAGCIAADNECFDLFQDLYDGVISNIYTPHQEHIKSLSDCSDLTTDVKFDPAVVKNISIRCYRNIEDFAYSPSISRARRRHINVASKQICSEEETLKTGKYESISNMSQSQYRSLAEGGITFTKPSSEEDVVNKIARDWPDARSLYRTKQNDLTIWVNGRHHLEFCSYSPQGKGFSEAIRKVGDSLNQFEQKLSNAYNMRFQWRETHGYLGPDLKELGNALSLEATVDIPLLSKKYTFIQIIKEMKLNAIPQQSEKDGVWKVWFFLFFFYYYNLFLFIFFIRMIYQRSDFNNYSWQ